MTDRTTLRRRLPFYLLAVLLACCLAGMAQTAYAQTPSPPPLPQPAPGAAGCIEANIFYGAVPPGGEKARVLVFVPGLAGLAQDWWTDQTVAGLNDMYYYAYGFGYRTAFVNANLIDPNGACSAERRPANDMLRNGQTLAKQIEAIVKYYNVSQVDVVGHSKGGIDAQSATVWFGAWRYVRNIITVGTPYQGSILADLLWSPEGEQLGDLLGQRDAGTFSLRTPLMQLFRLITDSSRLDDSVAYYTGAGNFWDTPDSIFQVLGAWIQAQPEGGGDNDGVIAVSSTRLSYADTLYLQPWNHAEITIGRNTFPYVLKVLLADVAPASDVALEGPATGTVGRDYDFTAILPPRTSQPVTYTWQATGQPTVVRSGGANDAITFAWSDTGPKDVVVTATNIAGSSTATHTVEINEVTGPEQLVLVGPVVGDVRVSYQFSAILPAATTLPITYTWQATGQPTLIHAMDTTQDVMSFNWREPGPKTIRVIAENLAGMTVAAYQINVLTPSYAGTGLNRYFPLMQTLGAPEAGAAQTASLAGAGSNTILRGGTLDLRATARFPVEPEASRMQVSLFTTDPAAAATLVGPDGSRAGLAAVPGAGTDFFAGAAALAGTVDAPAPGEWQVEMQSAQATAYLLLVTLDSSLIVQLRGVTNPIGLPEQLLELEAASQSSAGDTQVNTLILAVAGEEMGDGSAAQAASAGPALSYTTPAKPGLYSLSIQALGTTANGYAFERAFMQPLAVIPSRLSLEDIETILDLLKGFLP